MTCIRYERISILMLIIPFICPFFFFSNRSFSHRFLSSYESQSLNFCIHLQRVEVYCVKENHYAVIYFAFFTFLFFFPSLIPVECIGKFCYSGTTAPRILKLGTNIAYHYLYRVRQNQHYADHSLYSSIFSNIFFCQNMSQKLLHLGFWNFVQTLDMSCCKRKPASLFLSILLFVFFSSSEPKAQDELLWSLTVRPSVCPPVRPSVCPFTPLNDSSETPGPNFFKLYVELCVEEGLKIYKNGHGP